MKARNVAREQKVEKDLEDLYRSIMDSSAEDLWNRVQKKDTMYRIKSAELLKKGSQAESSIKQISSSIDTDIFSDLEDCNSDCSNSDIEEGPSRPGDFMRRSIRADSASGGLSISSLRSSKAMDRMY